MNGRLETNGLDITFSIDDDSQHGINITGGPLSYVYTITDIKFHYGKNGNTGSEHKIGNKVFPAEVWGICFFSRVFSIALNLFQFEINMMKETNTNFEQFLLIIIIIIIIIINNK